MNNSTTETVVDTHRAQLAKEFGEEVANATIIAMIAFSHISASIALHYGLHNQSVEDAREATGKYSQMVARFILDFHESLAAESIAAGDGKP